jgi:geranylgeranyl diphosphate synthase type I
MRSTSPVRHQNPSQDPIHRPAVPAAPPDDDPVAPIAGAVDARIAALLSRHATTWIDEQPALTALFDALAAFVAAGGKRLRPAFCYWGAVAAGARGDEPELVDMCAALELLHAFALIHDDVMDGSATRRGAPALHAGFASDHAAAGWAGESRRYGEGLAILAGDLAFVLADTLVDQAPAEARRLWHRLRVELVAGQWVDVVAAASTSRSPALARWVARYKSGRYTVERPLHLGAAFTGGTHLAAGFSAFGEPLGQAFQLRDDVLGVFGEPAQTGKPTGDDQREGKPTLLLALAAERAAPADRALLARVGHADLDDSEITELRRLFERCGARAAVEDEITRLTANAAAALARSPISDTVRERLLCLARRAVVRDR